MTASQTWAATAKADTEDSGAGDPWETTLSESGEAGEPDSAEDVGSAGAGDCPSEAGVVWPLYGSACHMAWVRCSSLWGWGWRLRPDWISKGMSSRRPARSHSMQMYIFGALFRTSRRISTAAMTMLP